MRALIVEDEATTRTLLTELLRSRQHEVTACPTAEEGWEAYLQDEYPLVLLNWMLPGMTGLDLCRQLRKQPQGRDSLILVITGRSEPGDLAAVLGAGADDYLSKPLDVGLLNVRLQIAEERMRLLAARRESESRQRQLEAKMQHSQKLESLGVLAGGIAHDFNNILVGILGHAGLALMEMSDDESNLRRHVQHIEQASLRASELTNQMLAYSGRGHFVIEALDLSAVVREMTDLLAVSISKSATVDAQLADDLPPVRGDASQLRQVAMNLITNASDALGNERGTIRLETGTVTIGPEQDGTYLPTDLEPGFYAYLEVSDDGCGMDSETQARIFDPFFTTKAQGRGLGLAAVIGIVRGHKGGIQVQSAVRRGTVVRVLWPCADQEVPAGDEEATPAPAAEPEWKGVGTVLVIDDESAVRSVARTTLERVGFGVLEASDGDDGVRIFEDRHPDLVGVILDLTMPRMSGRVALARIRQIRPDIPVVLSSGYAEPELPGGANATPVAFLRKPYRPAVLVDRMKSILIDAPVAARG